MVNEGGAGLGGDGVDVDTSPAAAVDDALAELVAGAAAAVAGLRYK